MLIHLSIGYFVYDFLAMTYYGLVDKTMTFHHLACIVGMAIPLGMGISGNFILQGMFIGEVSNTFMHARVILKHYGLRYTKAYELMEICFILLYIFGRMIIGPFSVYNTCICKQNPLATKLASVALTLQSVFFIFQMLSILRKRFKEISMRKARRVKSRWFDPLTKEELLKVGITKVEEKHIL
uniref:TLC domain-containing protein n=1 Tax=Strombidium rassoulzadegani TaxID=1082188 RepID=A0A7S3CUH1_9SPIT|mmetsp:Transcript_9650/g.16209  ORF Transcript_9650/g.16209 Transcript_9650/m.16209 type:complete len:183 (+) Transcript_9650:365-913(+)